MEQREVTGWTGWVTFGSILLIVDGVMQFIYGLAAIFNQGWYVVSGDSTYVVGLTTWGWAYLITGAILFLSGILLMSGSMFGRTMGTIFVVLGLLANIAFLAVTPVWSTLAIVVYALTAYAIIAHGGEMKELSA
jgi:hypothetical protein